MKNAFLIALSIVGSLVSGIILAAMAFSLAWGMDDFYRNFIGNSFLGLLIVAIAFFVPFFACRPLGPHWWFNSLLAVIPAILFLSRGIFANINMGNIPLALILPLGVVVAVSFIGGYFGKKRIKPDNDFHGTR